MLLGLLDQGVWNSWRREGTQLGLEGRCLLAGLSLVVLKWIMPSGEWEKPACPVDIPSGFHSSPFQNILKSSLFHLIQGNLSLTGSAKLCFLL